ncbi:ferric reduction oxidase 2 [Artemisia annua]|uniref:Ferric reduction oxidase 2 n=1 Tax=Artemisia annua TaxID=35608 RepID=A0A2U1MU15_ARTAN|nr:ferric reduction oxidase 2 [Artemisia annua]
MRTTLDVEIGKTNISVVAGELSLVAGLIMWATMFPRIRRKMFEAEKKLERTNNKPSTPLIRIVTYNDPNITQPKGTNETVPLPSLHM